MRDTMARATWASRLELGTVAAVLLGAVALTQPADAATLRWKFKAGQTLHYQTDQTTLSQVQFNGKQIKATNNRTIDMTWKVETVAPDGTAEITMTYDRMRAKVDLPNGAGEYDSKSEKAPNAFITSTVVPEAKLLVGSTFKFKMNPRGEISEVRVPESLVKSLTESSPQAGAAGSLLSEEGLKNQIRESSPALPAEELAVGKSWSRPTRMPPSPIGVVTIDKVYTYEGPGDGGEKLTLKITRAYTPPERPEYEFKVDEQDGKGTILFDNAAGRITSSSVTEKIKTTVTGQSPQFGRVTQVESTEMTTIMKLIDAS